MELKLSFAEALNMVDMPLAKLVVNDRECHFLVDTGANVCHIDTAFAKEIGAEEIPPIVDMTSSMLGDPEVTHSYSVAFTIDGVRLTDVPCAEADFKYINDSLQEYGMGMQGIIGMHVMRLLHGVIDLDDLTLTFRLPDAEQQSNNQ